MSINWELFWTLYWSLVSLQVTKELYGFSMYQWARSKEKKHQQSAAEMFGPEGLPPGMNFTLPWPLTGMVAGPNGIVPTVSGGTYQKQEPGHYL